jgi:hypothetical protein
MTRDEATLRALLARGCGLPAARDLTTTMLRIAERKRIEAETPRDELFPPDDRTDAPVTLAERLGVLFCFGCVFLALWATTWWA